MACTSKPNGTLASSSSLPCRAVPGSGHDNLVYVLTDAANVRDDVHVPGLGLLSKAAPCSSFASQPATGRAIAFRMTSSSFTASLRALSISLRAFSFPRICYRIWPVHSVSCLYSEPFLWHAMVRSGHWVSETLYNLYNSQPC